MMMFALSKINLLILAVALFTIVVYFTFGFQGVLVANLAKQEASKAMEKASQIIESQQQCRSIEISVPENIESASGQGYYFLMELRVVDAGDTNALIFSVLNRDAFNRAVSRGEEPPIVASQRRDQHAVFHIFSINKYDELCPSDSAILGFGIRAIPIDTVIVMKEIYQGVNNIYLVPCTSANDEDCTDRLQKAACWIKCERGSKSRCTDTLEPQPGGTDPCPAICNAMENCSEL
ncbi:MAG: hypothetical protein V1493_00510 [Candidatus Diapherotrites archaeon]